MLRVQTCLSTKQLVAGCEKLLQKVESSSTFCNKSWTCAFYRSKANLFCIKWRNSRVKRDFHATCNNLINCKTGLNVGGKTRNTTFQLFLTQCCKTGCTFSLPVWPQILSQKAKVLLRSRSIINSTAYFNKLKCAIKLFTYSYHDFVCSHVSWILAKISKFFGQLLWCWVQIFR